MNEGKSSNWKAQLRKDRPAVLGDDIDPPSLKALQQMVRGDKEGARILSFLFQTPEG